MARFNASLDVDSTDDLDQAIRAATDATSRLLILLARREAPVDTGDLRSSLRIRAQRTAGMVTIRLVSSAEHAKYNRGFVHRIWEKHKHRLITTFSRTLQEQLR